jgi:HlyD family secretion protein
MQAPSPFLRRRKPWFVVVLLLLLGVALAAAYTAGQGTAAPKKTPLGSSGARYVTQPVDRGRISRQLQASGTLQPVQQVQVGTQVSGTVAQLLVDFNDAVKTGQLLARIDPRLLDAELAQAKAALAALAANATLAVHRLERAKQLHADGFYGQAQLDEAQAAVAAAHAQSQQQQAVLARAQSNRAQAEIRSPVNGIVTAREVSVGQTVAASFATPLLFRIAQDLRNMQVEANVSEADIGLLKVGQSVQYTVDAFPGEAFEGHVSQIRNNFSVQQNVVTYTVVIKTTNASEKLRPGMTAYLRIAVAERNAVLRVPNAALRWIGPQEVQAPAGEALVWRLGPDGQPKAQLVKLGLADSGYTELIGSELTEGSALIIGQQQEAARFGPRFF